MFNEKLITATVIIYGTVSLLMIGTLLIYQYDAIRGRNQAETQRQVLNDQNESIVCILRIEPQDRTDALVSACRDETR